MLRTLAVSSILAAFASVASAQEQPKIVRFDPNISSGGKTSTRSGQTTTYDFYKSQDNPRSGAGVWDANGFKGTLRKTTITEFIHVLRGTITLEDKNGKELVFKQGDSLLIPKNTEVAWKNTENVREYWVEFDAEADPATGVAPEVIRLSSEGPAGKGLTGSGKTKEYQYFSGANKTSVGVWETAPTEAAGFHTPKYTEFMFFLSGTVTLSTPDGQSQTFHAGEAALVPRGADYKWKSDTVRKFWVIFDREPSPAITK